MDKIKVFVIVALAFVVVLFVAYQPYWDSSEIELSDDYVYNWESHTLNGPDLNISDIQNIAQDFRYILVSTRKKDGCKDSTHHSGKGNSDKKEYWIIDKREVKTWGQLSRQDFALLLLRRQIHVRLSDSLSIFK